MTLRKIGCRRVPDADKLRSTYLASVWACTSREAIKNGGVGLTYDAVECLFFFRRECLCICTEYISLWQAPKPWVCLGLHTFYSLFWFIHYSIEISKEQGLYIYYAFSVVIFRSVVWIIMVQMTIGKDPFNFKAETRVRHGQWMTPYKAWLMATSSVLGPLEEISTRGGPGAIPLPLALL